MFGYQGGRIPVVKNTRQLANERNILLVTRSHITGGDRTSITGIKISDMCSVGSMPAKDLFHQEVRHALEKEGWIVTHDPLHIELPDIEVYIDLGADRLLAAERESQKIAVEIKTFLGTSTLFEFHIAVGQFVNYRFLLNKIEPNRKLYLAVPVETYETFFRRETVQEMVQAHCLKLAIYNPDMEVIEQWRE